MKARWKIQLDPRYQRELAAIREIDPRVDDGQRAAEWVLQRTPERGNPVRRTPYFVWPLNTEAGRYGVYYRFGEGIVTLISVWRVPDERRVY